MVSQRLDEIVFTNSVQSRARNSPNGAIPFGGIGVPQASDAGMLFQVGTVAENIPAWSIYPWARDRALRSFYKTEPIMAGAVYTMTARLSALQYQLNGREELHEDIDFMLDNADYGNGFQVLISKTVNDLSTQDNGAFWELVGEGNPDGELLGGVALGVNYLDPQQCYRTYDPEYPVLYIDPLKGKQHKLHKSRVVMFSSMPQPNELARGVGVSPLSRALLSVQLMQSIQRYRYEKTSGQFERAIGYGTGMTTATLKNLLDQVTLDDENSGFVRFGKIPFFVSPRKEVALNILDLASIPDGFDLMSETEIYVMTVALAFGIDARELWAATQTGATKADASIQHLKTRGKGLADLINQLERAVNKYLMPDGMDFEYDFVDDEHDKGVAETNKVKADTLTTIKNAGGLSAVQYQAMLIHEGVLDENILMDAEQIAVDVPDDAPAVPVAPPIDGLPETDDETAQDPILDDNGQPIEKSMPSYNRELRNIMRGVIDKQIPEASAVQASDSAVRRNMMQAAMAGIEKAGLLKGDLTQEELMAIQNAIFNEQDYVIGLVEAAVAESRKEAPSYAYIFNRVDMWANRWGMMQDQMFVMASKNKKIKWGRKDGKDSCIDCITYDNRVYRGSVWQKADIRTKMWDLTCRGGHCGCEQFETDEPVNRGFPPQPKGRAA